jgi:hypothetical protein
MDALPPNFARKGLYERRMTTQLGSNFVRMTREINAITCKVNNNLLPFCFWKECKKENEEKKVTNGIGFLEEAFPIDRE